MAHGRPGTYPSTQDLTDIGDEIRQLERELDNARQALTDDKTRLEKRQLVLLRAIIELINKELPTTEGESEFFADMTNGMKQEEFKEIVSKEYTHF